MSDTLMSAVFSAETEGKAALIHEVLSAILGTHPDLRALSLTIAMPVGCSVEVTGSHEALLALDAVFRPYWAGRAGRSVQRTDPGHRVLVGES